MQQSIQPLQLMIYQHYKSISVQVSSNGMLNSGKVAKTMSQTYGKIVQDRHKLFHKWDDQPDSIQDQVYLAVRILKDQGQYPFTLNQIKTILTTVFGTFNFQDSDLKKITGIWGCGRDRWNSYQLTWKMCLARDDICPFGMMFIFMYIYRGNDHTIHASTFIQEQIVLLINAAIADVFMLQNQSIFVIYY